MGDEHICNAGVTKLEVLPTGDIIPCPACKDAARDHPEVFILGNIRDTTLKEALKRGRKIPYLRKFRRWNRWGMKWRSHLAGCEICAQPDGACTEGLRILLRTDEARNQFLDEKEKLYGTHHQQEG
jgi:radical SAM protein with 4Fe4S-binding SPASM domain